MKTHNPQNERTKRAYFTYLAEAKGFSEATLDGVAKALNRFETYTRFRDFKAFHIEQAKGFKASLAEQMSVRTKDRLSKATLYATLSALKRFFIWLAGQPGFKSRISYSDAEYFNLSAKETRIAKAHRDARVPTLEQIQHVIRTMSAGTETERRDRALIAFTILTGARDGAIASLKLKHVDIDQDRVDQDARQVKTKLSKSFAAKYEVQPIIAEVHEPAEIENTITKLGGETGSGVALVPDNFTTVHRELIISLTARFRIPAIYPYRYFAEAGGLLSYGVDASSRHIDFPGIGLAIRNV
jgi:hypothetical protein